MLPRRTRVPWKPTRAQVEAARGRTVPDVIAPGLRILFCGINPGLYTAAVGHHFARPGNRFWIALHLAGITPSRLSPFDEEDLLPLGLGVTNLVMRATPAADELDEDELRRGAARLARKALRYRPRIVAVLGIGAYRVAFGRAGASVGRQKETLGASALWVLPNPSGRTAGYQLPALVSALGELATASAAPRRARASAPARRPAPRRRGPGPRSPRS